MSRIVFSSVMLTIIVAGAPLTQVKVLNLGRIARRCETGPTVSEPAGRAARRAAGSVWAIEKMPVHLGSKNQLSQPPDTDRTQHEAAHRASSKEPTHGAPA